MNREEFVMRMFEKAVISSVAACVKTLRQPAGRKPQASLVEASQWFNELADSDRAFVERCVKRGAEMALFSVFTVLDGVSFIEDAGSKGDFELYFRKDGERVLLNPQDGELLHEMMPSDPM